MAKDSFYIAGSLPQDGSSEVIQSGNTFEVRDATGTPQNSPLAYTTSETVIVVPDRAVEMVLAPTTDLRVSDVTGMARYYVVPGGAAETFPVAKMTNVYVKGDAAAGSLRFRFTVV